MNKFVFLCAGGLIVVAFASLFIISGVFRTPEYLKPWHKSYSKGFDDLRIRTAACGLLSANGHNMQPWKIKLDKSDSNVFYLYADNNRLTKDVDPYARQMMISEGTFLEYVSVAAAKEGFKADMKLFPSGNDYVNQPVAKVTLSKTDNMTSPLYDYMFLPDTNREAYMKDNLTSHQIESLKSTNTDSSMEIKIYQDNENIKKLGRYAMDSAVIEADVSRVMEESENIFRPNEYEKNKYRYGFSVEGQGTSGIMKHLMQGLVTFFPSMNKGKASSDNYIKSAKTSVDNTPAYIMILTKNNSRESQVKSGMLYSRLVLEAQSLGLAMQPLSQALEEYPEMSRLHEGIHKDYAPDNGTIQMLFRIGAPTGTVTCSMRRDVMDLVM